MLGRQPGTQVFRELDEHPDDEQIPGVVVLRLDGGLFFATSDTLEDRLRQVIHATPDLTGIVLDCEGINFIDSQGSAKLLEMVELAEESGDHVAAGPAEGVGAADPEAGRRVRALRPRTHPRQRLPGRGGPARGRLRTGAVGLTRSARSARAARRAAGRGR